jgi:hypothetical protein
MGQLNRIVPILGPENYKTFSISKPRATHTRPATCAEVQCDHHVNGWKNKVALTDEVSLAWIKASRYGYHQESINEGFVTYKFHAGQICFCTNCQNHTVSLDRPELYVVRGGDWRGDPRHEKPRVHTRPEHWVEDMQENLDKVRKDREG